MFFWYMYPKFLKFYYSIAFVSQIWLFCGICISDLIGHPDLQMLFFCFSQFEDLGQVLTSVQYLIQTLNISVRAYSFSRKLMTRCFEILFILLLFVDISRGTQPRTITTNLINKMNKISKLLVINFLLIQTIPLSGSKGASYEVWWS